MKKVLIIALTGILSLGTIMQLPIQSVFAQEEKQSNIISESFFLEINTSIKEYFSALNDPYFFDGKSNSNPLYNLLKEQIIKIAKGEGELTFTFEIENLNKSIIDSIIKQILLDMEPYFYWSNGKGSYWYIEEEHHITFTFEKQFDGFLDEQGIYNDGRGNIFLPWFTVESNYISLEQLKEQCGDSLVLILDDDNEHILFVGGNFSNQKVSSSKEALEAIDDMKKLMGLSDHASLYCYKTTNDSLGNTYYSFVEKNDNLIELDKLIIIGVDQESHVTCISNSSQEAWKKEDYTMTELNDSFFQVFEEQYGFTFLNKEANLVYYEPLYQMCYEFIVLTQKGNYAKMYYKVIDEKDNLAFEFYDSLEALETEEPYESYFKDTVETPTMTFMDYFGNEVVLPVSYKEGKGYYLLDQDRKILGTATYEYHEEDSKYYDLLEPYYFTSPEEVSPIYVSSFKNLTQSYDSYKELNLFEIDRPVILNFSVNDMTMNASATLHSNTILINVLNNDIGASYDTMAHELSHAIQMIVSNPTIYENTNGTIMESYADICGNILEMLAKKNGELENMYVDEYEWLLGESTETVFSSMKNPSNFQQPSQVYGKYYTLNNSNNLHTNRSILNQIAYRMNTELNLSYEQILSLFYSTEYLLNRQTDYQTVEGYLEYFMKKSGFSTETITGVKQLFIDANIHNYDSDECWDNIQTADDFIKILISLTDGIKEPENTMVTLSISGKEDNKPILSSLQEDNNGIFGTIESVDYNQANNLVCEMHNDSYGESFGKLYFEEPIFIEGDTQIQVNAEDVISALYAGIKQNKEEQKESLVQTYEDTMKQFLIKDTSSSKGSILTVYNKNQDSKDVSVYFNTNYNTSLEGYDVLLRTDSSYDFEIHSDETRIYENIDVSQIDTNEIVVTD